MKTSVGGDWPRTSERVTDLGTITSSEAATYFFGLVPQIERFSSGRDKSRFLLPAVLADDPIALPRLISLARDDARLQETRRQAIQWIGLLGDARVVPVLVEFARGGGAAPAGEDIDVDDEAPGRKGLATTAMAALSTLGDGAGFGVDRPGAPQARGHQRSGGLLAGSDRRSTAFAALHGVIENGQRMNGSVRSDLLNVTWRTTRPIPNSPPRTIFRGS